MSFVENVSNKVASKIAATLNMDKDNEEIIAYGAFNLIQISLSIFWVIVFGLIFGVLVQALIISLVIGLLRKYSGGVHANSPKLCIVVGTTVAVGFALMIKNFFIKIDLFPAIFLGLAIFIFSYYIVFKLAPVDSPAKPIKKVETRQKLKKSSIRTLDFMIVVNILLMVFYINTNSNFYMEMFQCICLAILWQSFTLTNIGHKVLGNIK